MILGTHTIQVLRAPTVSDDYGNPIRNWAGATSVTLTGCSVQPLLGSEYTLERDFTVSRWTLYAPVADIRSTDRIQFEGLSYDVDGEVQRWDFEGLPHLTALLKRGTETTT